MQAPPPSAGYPYPAPPYRPHPTVVVPPYPFEPPPRERAFRPWEILVAFALVCVADTLLWNSMGGISFAIVIGLGAALVFAHARIRRAPLKLALTAVLLTLVMGRAVLLPTAGTVISGIVLLFALAVQVRTRSGASIEAFLSSLRSTAALPSRLSAFSRGVWALGKHVPVRRSLALQVGVPALLLVLFGGVFSLANPVVGHYAEVTFTWLLSLVRLPSVTHVLFFCALVPMALVLLRPSSSLAKPVPAVDRTLEAKSLSIGVARNSLVALNVAFAGFLALDANYLWRGAPPPGMTTQTYAHQGAFWLTVALFLTTLVVGIFFRGALAFDAKAKMPRALAWGWMAQNALLAISVFRRMAIHVNYSGMSNLRIVGYFGAGLVVVGLVLVAMKLHGVRTTRWLVGRQIDAFVVASILFAVLPTHRLSAYVNVARISSGELRPALHLFAEAKQTESADALLPLLGHSDVRIREGVAGLLLDHLNEMESAHELGEADGTSSWAVSVLSKRAPRQLSAEKAHLLAVLGPKDPEDVRQTLYELVVAANEGKSLEVLLTIPPARSRHGRSYGAEDSLR